MTGFYPPKQEVYKVVRNSKENCYEIILNQNVGYCSATGGDLIAIAVVKSNISTRKDAVNQAKSLNFVYEVRK